MNILKLGSIAFYKQNLFFVSLLTNSHQQYVYVELHNNLHHNFKKNSKILHLRIAGYQVIANDTSPTQINLFHLEL